MAGTELDTTPWRHDHVFGQDRKRPGEGRTLLVILLTAVTMVVEITAGIVFGSMALLADGLHMASHAAALAIAMFAYIYARRRAHDPRFSFGTGKVNSLAGFTGALLLAGFALVMVWESGARLISPVEIAFNQAIAVAVIGLLVNGVSVLLLDVGDGHSHDHGHEHDHHDKHHDKHHDHNLRSAYLHVLADALTSVLAIVALLAGKYWGLDWLDPVMGVVGALLVGRWSLGLMRTTSRVLLDHRGPAALCDQVQKTIEALSGTEVADLHLWQIGPGLYGLVLSVVSQEPQSPAYYRQALQSLPDIVHITVEVNRNIVSEASEAG